VESEVVFFEKFKGRNEILCWRDKISNSVVIIVLLLAESRAWNGHDSGFVDHIHAVHEISWDVLFTSFFKCLFGEMDLWESVHGTLNVVAGGPLHVVKSLGEEASSLLETVEDLVLFSHVLFVALDGFTALSWWVYHQ